MTARAGDRSVVLSGNDAKHRASGREIEKHQPFSRGTESATCRRSGGWGLVPQGKLQQDRGSLLEFGFDRKVATEFLCPSAHVR